VKVILRGAPGHRGPALIVVIFAWNEFFFGLNLTAVNAQTCMFTSSG